MFNNRRPSYTIKPNVKFKNNFTNEVMRGDLVNEESIDGKPFFVVKVGQRHMKLSKEGYTIVRSSL